MRFRDESDKVVTKYLNKKTDEEERTKLIKFNNDVARYYNDPHEKPMNLNVWENTQFSYQDVRDPAVNFFVNTYIKESHFAYLPEMLSCTSTDSALVPSVQAAALASLSNDSGRPDLLVKANECYVEALRTLNTILEDKEKSHADETVAAIMVLAMFENMAHKEQGTKSYSQHVNGALAILRQRMDEPITSAITLSLIRQVIMNTQIECIQQCVRIPPVVHQLMAKLKDSSEKSIDWWLKYSLITNEYADFRATVGERNGDDSAELINWGESIDGELGTFATVFSKQFPFEVVPTYPDSPSPYPQNCHVYKNTRHAHVWNSIRLMRLTLNEITYDLATQLLSDEDMIDGDGHRMELTEAAARFRGIILEMAGEICSSVPQLLGRTESRLAEPASQIASGHYLVWALWVVGRSSHVLSCLRLFASRQLRYVATQSKLPQALQAAEQLDAGLDEETWMHMSYSF